jgi:hypothetical protein
MVLLDSDQEGKSAYEQLVHQWIMDNKYVLMLGKVLGVNHPCTLEDLFSEDYYLEHVNAAYCSELGKKTLKLGRNLNLPIIERVEEALKAQGIERFNKGRIAKRIMKDLAKKTLAEVPQETVENFRKVITTINKTVQAWKTRQ